MLEGPSTGLALPLARAIVLALEVYAAVGLGFAALFVAAGAARVDPAARGAGLGFRLLILPASAALWPWLLVRWIRGSPPPEERTAHRALAARTAQRAPEAKR